MTETPSPLILMYHHIARPPKGAEIRGMYVSPRQFDWQIGWLKARGYSFHTFAELAAGLPPSNRQVILTLDDGYRNNFEQAFPILLKHAVKAVIYPILDDLGRRDVTWPGATEQTPADMMTREQVREMADAGIDFGSHLLQHRKLTDMPEAEQVEQLNRSREGLEAITQAPVTSIAYPYGAYDESVMEMTRAAGYSYAVTTEPGVNRSTTDPLCLKRFTAKGCKIYHPLKFQRMILSAERQSD